MPSQYRIRVGDRLPDSQVAEVIDGVVRATSMDRVTQGKRSIIVGVPGAFTPICSSVHLPRFIHQAQELKRSGFDQIVCITPSNPFAVDAWAEQIDPDKQLRFLADGELEFGRSTGLTTRMANFFLGECYERFVLICQANIVLRVSVERSALDVTCTAADTCFNTVEA